MSFLKPFFTIENYFSNPNFIAAIMFLFVAFKVPVIVALVYAIFVFIDNSPSELEEVKQASEKELLSLEFKRKDESIAKVSITAPELPQATQRQHVYELLFRDRDSKLVKGFDVKDAITNAKLTKEEMAEFAGAEQLT